ncbi:MAG: NAD(P)H-dependent oxidoreductase [Clostridia bacterium]|nr:NAD(P)H-dependent oxidoreductase [Clostridia bacterium]
MKTLLYIDCCIRREDSRTRLLAERFLAAVEARGEYSVEKLCLMDENLSPFSDGFFAQRERLLAATALDHPRFRYAHQFQRADRVLIAAPFWDLSFPALLKIYIENISVDGVTFRCDASGCAGVCRAERLCYITTRGGCYEGTPLEQGARYIEAMCAFFGIPRFDCVAAEGLDLGLEAPDTILARAYVDADMLAAEF